jgi:CheY-like chemotaxis protein
MPHGGVAVPKILVADDNTNIQKMVALAFQERGIDVISVGNGEAAVRRLPDLNPDMVLADIFMPVRNGYEVCEFIKKDTRFAHIPVILLIGAFDPLDEKEARRVGADGVLKKPFVPPDPLIAMVISVLEKNPRVAAEMAKAKQKAAAPPEAPAIELPVMPIPKPKPLPHFPEPSPEELALAYGISNKPRAVEVAPNQSSEPIAPVSEQSQEEFDGALTSRDWRRSAMDFEIPEEDAKRPAFGGEDVSEPAVAPSIVSAANEIEASTQAASSAPIPAPVSQDEFVIVESVVEQEMVAEDAPKGFAFPTQIQETAEAAPEFPIALQDFGSPVEAEKIETRAETETATTVSEASASESFSRVEEAREETPAVKVAPEPSAATEFQSASEEEQPSVEAWPAPKLADTENDDEVPVHELSVHESLVATETPEHEFALHTATASDEAGESKAAVEQAPPPVTEAEERAKHEIQWSEILSRKPSTETEPLPTKTNDTNFTSRVRSWMDSISPSGNPEGGWLASVANVLSGGDKAKHGQPTASESEAASATKEIAAEKAPQETNPPAAAVEAQALAPTSKVAERAKPTTAAPLSLADISAFTDVMEEPFFLDEAFGHVEALSTPIQASSETEPSSVASEASSVSEVASEKVEPVVAAATEPKFESVSPAEEDSELPVTLSRGSLFKDPNLEEPVGVAVKPEPLLIDENTDSRERSSYGARQEALPPVHSFTVPETSEPAVTVEASEEKSEETREAHELQPVSKSEAWESAKSEQGTKTEASAEVSELIASADWRDSVPAAEPESDSEAALIQARNWNVETDVLPGNAVSEAPLPETKKSSNSLFALDSESFESAVAKENEWARTAPPPNREALREIPFLRPPRDFLEENAHDLAEGSLDADSESEAAISANGSSKNRSGESANAADIEHSPSEASVKAVAKELMVDEVVRKVLERLEPRLHELLSQGLVKPLVESIIHEESERK